MAEEEVKDLENGAQNAGEEQLEGGAYEVLRKRLQKQNSTLCERLEKINVHRKEVFGGEDSKLSGNERIQTENNCIPRDIIGIGQHLIFGYNVYLGLRSETKVSDVFSIYNFDGKEFQEEPPDLLNDETFARDFNELYKYYKNVRFLQFIKTPGRLLLIFQVGESIQDVKVLRFNLDKDKLSYLDNRGDMEYKLPPQHDFEWIMTTRDNQVAGDHPHVSILDKVFVETIEGDLTIKIEDNTNTGEGIYSEPVDNPDQTLDDGRIYYAEVGDLILIKVLPFREEKHRYFVFNTKKETATRIDSLEHACIELPENHGIIFPKGYYRQDGTVLLFEDNVEGMQFLECIKSPNGEDFLYVFYHEELGKHILLQYNLISKELSNPIFCHGYSLYDDGKMVLFNAPDSEPKRTHPMQIWNTPFFAETFEQNITADSYYVKVGNRDLVRGISEGYAISRLITSEEVSLYTYEDTIRAATNMIGGYHWLEHEEAFNLKESIQEIRTAAIAAVEEYEKVVRLKENTKQQIAENSTEVKKILLEYTPESLHAIDEFVKALAAIRTRRGQVISLRELRYCDLEKIDQLDNQLAESNETVSQACVQYLLRDDALVPYVNLNQELETDIEKAEKIADLKPLNERLEELAESLDLLTDIVNNLQIEDATETTRIVDGITDVYAGINRTRSIARNLRKELGKSEAAAEFGAQYKLVSQSITNYIGMCDSIEKCDEFLTKIMITIEELEGRFADYDEYVAQLTEKREEAYTAFSGRKQILDEEKKRKVQTLVSSAQRILKGVINRAETFKDVNEINSYFASDLMVSKLRDIIEKLFAAGDSVKGDDLNGQLKSAKDEISRRLRDKLDLFEDGDNIIKFGDYKFTVNTQPLALTTVHKDKEMFYHLTGSDFYEQIVDPEFVETKPLWNQELVSENEEVYRAEYLAYKILMAAIMNQQGLSLVELTKKVNINEGVLDLVRDFSSSLYNEGYDKGIHDHDATEILKAIVKLYNSCLLLRYDSESRAHGILFWCYYDQQEIKNNWRNKLRSFGELPRVFGYSDLRLDYVQEIREHMVIFFRDVLDREVEPAILSHAAEWLYYELQDQELLEFTINKLADDVNKRFVKFIHNKKVAEVFAEDIGKVKDVKARINLIFDWVNTFVLTQEPEESLFLVWEVVALLAAGEIINQDTTSVSTYVKLDNVFGQHKNISEKCLDIYFDRFLLKMKNFTEVTVPMFQKYTRLRAELTEQKRVTMRLDEFKPKVMGAFVRNKLINDVYLNLVGANFAKQMGAAGEKRRTDLMGLLLLISPPGYGKTTLMEYIAHRLGLTFMKINGPAIGHLVTSLDPSEAPNATSREELNKLNLSLEMGNNVMIYLDDIQHLNPEFLQKFISLCDAQRKIEGVYNGITRTYDLRGKKVSVVMAGNPYTESGDKFRIPDMLANRADTYNLGDISSTAAESFGMSFIENAMTSNPVLSNISSHGHADIYKFMDVIKRGSSEGIEFDYNYSASEVNEITDVLRKLSMIRDVVLMANQNYIQSAAQEDDYRTEPPFKMQGSYRNMNRMAEKVFPVMTDDEVKQIIIDHYYNEAQTLTTGAESNILKFKELMNLMTEEDQVRWDEIRSEFGRRQTMSGMEDSDDIAKIVTQLSVFGKGVSDIHNTLSKQKLDLSPIVQGLNAVAEAGKAQTFDVTPIVEGLNAVAESNKSQTIDMTPLTQAVKKMSGKAETPQLDLSSITEAIKAAAASRSEAPPQDAIIEHIGGLVKRQTDAFSALLPTMESINAQSESFHLLTDVLHRLVRGEIGIELNNISTDPKPKAPPAK